MKKYLSQVLIQDLGLDPFEPETSDFYFLPSLTDLHVDEIEDEGDCKMEI